MEKIEIPYLRIGTNYYKIVEQPLASGDVIRKIIPWIKSSIDEDHGNGYRSKNVLKYDTFCLIPDHLNYKREVGRNLEAGRNGSYNLYEPIIWERAKGEIEKTLIFLKHIFEEQLDIGLDYLTIIFRYPTQILPILCLVSTERNTGKTTFLNWLKIMYQDNMTINTNEDFRNQFNSGWASKLIIGVDEVLLDKKEDAEKIKNLSTSRNIKSEAKGKDKIEQEFFGKFVLCSNNESEFIKIPPDEIRFWIRKIQIIKVENVSFLKELKSEIPAFLHFLKERTILSENKTRMWFSREQLFTEALRKVIYSGTTKLEKELRSLIIDQILQFNLEKIKLTPKDILELLKSENNIYASKTEIIDIIRIKWRVDQEKEAKYYHRYSFIIGNNDGDYIIQKSNRTGRFYVFKKGDFIS